jgi:surfeit locus 1 family protein
LPIPLFVALGLWQLDRAGQKRELAATLAARAELPPLALGGPIADPQALRYRQIQATGTFLAERQILIEGRREGGRLGFHVITPLELADSGPLLLVNRGWIPADARGEPGPAPVPAGPQTVAGEAEIPSAPALALHGGDEAARSWGKRWPYLTLGLFGATTERPIEPVIMLLDPQAQGGFVRHWSRPVPNDAMHLGYALQWLGFALIALVIYLRIGIDWAPRPKGDS